MSGKVYPKSKSEQSTESRIPTLAYYRRSTDKEAQGASLSEQKQWATRACAHEQLRIAHAFEDDAVSGGKRGQFLDTCQVGFIEDQVA